jgi:outer membrane protein OmpA-like peptidoglycan-associated protein
MLHYKISFTVIGNKINKMKKLKMQKILMATLLVLTVFVVSCKTWNKSQKGAVIGTAGGAAAGAVVGKVAGNTALGAIIGAAVGGVTGAIIGHKMDKQAEEMQANIPDVKIERVGEGIVIEFKSQVLFGFDKSNLSDAAKGNLAKLVMILQKYPDTNIEIQGHTDNTGTDSYNQTLSGQRASAVSDYLAAHGINTIRLTIKGFGESLPKYSNNTTDGQMQNRRVEFLISANEKMKADAAKEAGK